MDLKPNFIRKEVEAVEENLLPHKSKQRYLKSYEDFMKWRAEKKVNSLTESDLLIYFNELSKTYKPSTLWSVYSMLKTTLSTKHNVHLKNFVKLSSFLKKQAVGFKSKKSKVFTSQEIETFLNQAPDIVYLAMKVSNPFVVILLKEICIKLYFVQNLKRYTYLFLGSADTGIKWSLQKYRSSKYEG